MKRTLLFLLLAMASVSAGWSQSVKYVRWNAPGNNDGSSWMDAYRDLQDALNSAVDGDEIWIASGTYYPGGLMPDTLSTFQISAAVALYGGFMGNETSLGDRNPAGNPTVLSGDLARNDVSGDFLQNRGDNARHVVTVIADSTDLVTLDGLMITNGHTTDNGNLPPQFFSGGGVLSFSPLYVIDCRFTENFGRTGGCIAQLAVTEVPTEIRTSRFDQNGGTSQSAGIYMAEQKLGVIADCVFENNQTNRGALYLLDCTDFTVRNCRFENNVNAGGFGGAYYNWNCVNTIMENCQFIGNEAANAGGIYIDGRDGKGLGITISNTLFQENNTPGRGAAIYGANAEYKIIGCEFMNNTATRTGGGLHASNDKYEIDNCRFFGNVAGWGPGVTTYNEFAVGTIKNCTFESNQALTSGGAVSNGFKATVTYEDNVFLGNQARFGGAMYIQNDTTAVTVTNCEFGGNVAETGGAFYNGAGTEVLFNNCEFIANQANFGAGIHIGDTDSDLTYYELINCVFNFNIAAQQGGGINISNANGYMENCLIINNFADGDGVGAAMSVNGAAGQSAVTSMMNCTVAENFGALAAGVSQWTEGGGEIVDLNLQNTIFKHSDGSNYAVEDGSPTVTSNGGNLCSEASLADLLTHPLDVKMDAEFVDDANDDYHLMPGSPGVNAGNPDGAPTTDLDGNPRDSKPDAGSYEYQDPNGLDWFAAKALSLELYPNPVSEELRFTLPEEWSGTTVWMIVDMNGKYVRTGNLVIAGIGENITLPVADLGANTYHLLLLNKSAKAIGSFQKF